MSPIRIAIKPSDVGKRVTVQYFTDDGERREAVGLLENVAVVEGEVIFHIRRRDESLVKVPLGRIRLGKVV